MAKLSKEPARSAFIQHYALGNSVRSCAIRAAVNPDTAKSYLRTNKRFRQECEEALAETVALVSGRRRELAVNSKDERALEDYLAKLDPDGRFGIKKKQVEVNINLNAEALDLQRKWLQRKVIDVDSG